MSKDFYLGMRPGDLDNKPYAKYWNPRMGPMQPQAQQAILHGTEAAELGISLAEANQLLEDGYLPLENGYTRLNTGEVFAAVLTRMPRVDEKMIDWWFGWHYLEHERYKLWHPRAHVANGAQKMISDDPSLSDREKYLNNPNYVTEYIGSRLQRVAITFAEPSTYFDVSRFQKGNIGTVICGTIAFRKAPVKFGVLMHLIRRTEDGCEMRSRFWLGNLSIQAWSPAHPVNRMLGSNQLTKYSLPLAMGRDLLVHCAMEMNHLASFLPALYEDYHREA
jgi:DAPG hydrolase PhiG domain